MRYPLLLLTASSIFAADDNPNCEPEPAATCYPDDCRRCYCLGPENTAVNPAVRPVTCDGDISITVAGFYWQARQDGMEYAVDNAVALDQVFITQPANNLINAEYTIPDFDWNFGFKLGLAYISPCDGWDIGAVGTRYHGRASSHVESELEENNVLLTLWSDFGYFAQGAPLFATDIQTHWKLDLSLVDIELGREFWTSKYLSLRPFVGLRLARIDQKYEIQHKGGAFEGGAFGLNDGEFNNEVTLDNDFNGIGLRSGLELNWHLGCGWSIYSDLAGSIVYGRFSVDHDEVNREAIAPFEITKILETKNHFRASRAMLDLNLGLQWSSLICDCKYGLTARLGWEHHLFFHQNQMWRVNRVGPGSGSNESPNNLGENVFQQCRGTLSTQGWTLTFKFDF